MQLLVRKLPLRILLPVFTGVMLSLAWLGFPGWTLFVAFLPLLLLDDFYVSNRQEYRSVSFWGWALLSFLVWNVMTTWWIMHATVAGALFAITANSLFMSLVFWAAHLVRRITRESTGYLAYVVFWMSFEYAHYHWDIEWPWLTLGNGFAGNVKVIQWYEFTGNAGGSLWVLVVNILIYNILKKMAGGTGFRYLAARLTLLALLVFLPVLYSWYRFNAYTEVANSRKVLIIQPNIDPYTETHDAGAVNEKLMRFIQLAETNLSPGLDYIVGPETVFEENWNEALLTEYPAFRALQQLSETGQNTSLVIGASTYRLYDDAEKAPLTARHSRDGAVYDVYNTALFTDKSGGYQVYHKSILVPGVEKMPYRKYLRFLDKLIINLGGTSGTLGIQKEPTNFVAPNGDLIAPAICYESVFGGYIASFVRKGAGMIFVITNDGWWKNTPGYRQHFSFSRLRAIETRRSIVRCANTGISGVINQRGEVVSKSRWWEERALTAEVNVNNRLTFYVKYGDVLSRTAVLVSLVLLLNVLVLLVVKGKKNPHQF